MIANPSVPAFRYDPYSKKLTRERYDHRQMQDVRDDAVQAARKSIEVFTAPSASRPSNVQSPPMWGVVLGTLGRQGNFNQLQAIQRQLSVLEPTVTTDAPAPVPIPHIPILLSELSPAKLALFNPHISTFVQTSCPRLSIDWGYAFDKPLLTPYECSVAVGRVPSWKRTESMGENREEDRNAVGVYPMDFYEAGSLWAVSRSTATI
jgi:2-(3-amino-3-carboxypropyl)histidine synthase